MTRIGDLSADELARHAFNVFLYQGRTQRGGRLAYHALTLDPRNAAALRSLSDLLDQPGTEVLAAVVMEYVMDPASGFRDDEKAALDAVLFRARWWWGFAKHDSGQKDLTAGDFEDRSRFRLDEERYRAFLGRVVGPSGGLEQAARAAHLLMGTVSGLMAHVEKGDHVELPDLLQPERFERTPAYDAFLDSPLGDLEKLEIARQEKRWPSPEDYASARE